MQSDSQHDDQPNEAQPSDLPVTAPVTAPAGHQLVGSSAMYQTLVASLPLCLLIKGVDGRRLFANPAYLEYHDAKLEDILGKHDRDLFPPEVAERFTSDDQHVMATGQPFQGVEETQSADGTRRWIERFKCPLCNDAGEVVGVQLLFWDITARKLAELHRDRERQLLQTLLDNIPDSIYFKDRESHFIRVSAGMAQKFRLASAEAVIGLTDADIFTPEHASMAREDELEIMRTNKPIISLVERETWPDREDTWCSTTKLPLSNESGEVIGTFGISRDITDLKHTQDQLAHARDAADQANRAKSDFLANMSHEMRTPMNAISGMSELLSRTSLSRDQRDSLELVRDAADSLLRLLNDILDFSKIEASRLELEKIPFSLRDCIGKTGQTLSLRAAQQGLELVCRIAPDIPDRLIGDPGRLRQILINLIGNAIKFTERGEVFINAIRDPATPADRPALRLQFSVQDTGIGIPADKQATVLDAFTQADSSTTRRYGGTGLGLSISSQLAKLMGGDLWLESELGVGTTFYFTVNLEIAPSQCLEASGAITDLKGLDVLVVDDNATNRRILHEILSAWGLKPILVASGQQAIDAITLAAEKNTPYRLAILDCMMPDMDGFGVAQHIRQRFDSSQTQLIILSSATRTGDSERCERMGIARYLTKPVIHSELLDAVLQVMHDGVVLEAIVDPARLVPCRPLRVLLAEDGLANKIVAKGLVEAGGHTVITANNGREAVQCWEQDHFDLILMDMHMPEMDGIQATLEIRVREQQCGLSPIPIIAITAAAMPEDTRLCLQSGMDAFLAKPLQPDSLYQTIAKFAELAPNLSPDPNSGATKQAASIPTTLDNRNSAEQLKGTDVLDLEYALKRIPGGINGLRKLAEVFGHECDQLLRAMADAIARGDAAEVQRASHTIKGSAKLFSATRVSSVALDIEQSAKAGDLAATPRLHGILQSEIAELRAALDVCLSESDQR